MTHHLQSCNPLSCFWVFFFFYRFCSPHPQVDCTTVSDHQTCSPIGQGADAWHAQGARTQRRYQTAATRHPQTERSTFRGETKGQTATVVKRRSIVDGQPDTGERYLSASDGHVDGGSRRNGTGLRPPDGRASMLVGARVSRATGALYARHGEVYMGLRLRIIFVET